MRETTRAEIREFLTKGLAPVACHACGNRVLVRKTSLAHTSVEWISDPATSCPEFAARVAAGELTARIDGCPKLRASIELAVAEGLVEVPDG
jgi:DNA-directed RNA polymerase subunit RPC12/RpoP